MRPSQKHRPPDDGPNQEWMVTFSDCMTLLLTFFVMLLAFSSFDPRVLARISGAIEDQYNPTIFFRRKFATDSPAPSPRSVVDRTEEGSEKRTFRLEPTYRPREPLDALSADAYRDRRVLTIPSDLLFWAEGAQLRPEAKAILDPLAQYLRQLPSRVVIAETGTSQSPGRPAAGEDRALMRALAVMDHLSRAENLGADRFGVAAASAAADATGPEAAPVVHITMLNPKVYP